VAILLFKVLHGEQYLEIVTPLRSEGKLTTRANIIDVQQKKSGAVIAAECELLFINLDKCCNIYFLVHTYDESGQLMTINQSSTFVVGGKSNNSVKGQPEKVITIQPAPKRAPDYVATVPTFQDQAALYRLSGDLNPLHIDPQFSVLGGFPKPIIHGLATFGSSVRAVLRQYANNDPSLFKAVKVRFTKPVLPGDVLKVEMWQEGNRIHFRTFIEASKAEVISGEFQRILKN
jgi:(3R)-3-hydroxyacyl-CoA dehydrogenase / 3a,7a,12a-trihydroxy-5b-cholest-24-enoyl-CoA hydratase / enoyl-CoA hydratase 2